VIRTAQLSDVPALVVVFVNWRLYSFRLAVPKSVNLGVKSCENKMLSCPAYVSISGSSSRTGTYAFKIPVNLDPEAGCSIISCT
jgi:hypothetical protein